MQISAPHIPIGLLLLTSTVFRMFIFISKSRNKCTAAHTPSDWGYMQLCLLGSFGRSPQTIITTRWAPAEGRCCKYFAARSIKLLCKTWALGHRIPSVYDGFSAKGVVHLGWWPWLQPDSANTSEAYDIFTEISGHHNFPVEKRKNKQSWAGEKDVNMEEIFRYWSF